jgi:hypothetical protein
MERSCTVLVYESSFTTVSLHKTEKGAEIGFIRKTSVKNMKKCTLIYLSEKSELYVEFGNNEAWIFKVTY